MDCEDLGAIAFNVTINGNFVFYGNVCLILNFDWM